MTGVLRAAALDYAARDWPVLPLWWPTEAGCACGKADCGSVGKHPLRAAVPNGLLNASTDLATVASWWDRWPKANVGMRTGVAFDVFDVDHDDPIIGTEHLPPFDLAGGPVARTGKGWHFLVKPTGLGNAQKFERREGGHCDWRGAGGYIVAPPSLHQSGRLYSWYSSVDLPLHDAPEVLRDRMTRRPEPTPRPQFAIGWSGDLLRRATSGGIEGIVDKVRNAPHGQRNATLWWAARLVGLKVYRCELSEPEGRRICEHLLPDAGLATGLGGHEVASTITSGWTTGRKGIEGRVAA